MLDTVVCPACQRRLRLPVDFAVRDVLCPSCGVVCVPADVPAALLPPLGQAEPAEYPAPVLGDTWYYAEDERQWEREGFVRRDCEPHRGGLVQTLGIVSLCCLIGFLCGGILVTGPGLGLGIAAWVMGSRDLAR